MKSKNSPSELLATARLDDDAVLRAALQALDHPEPPPAFPARMEWIVEQRPGACPRRRRGWAQWLTYGLLTLLLVVTAGPWIDPLAARWAESSQAVSAPLAWIAGLAILLVGWPSRAPVVD